MIHSMMQWVERWEWLIIVFSIYYVTFTHTPSLAGFTPKLERTCSDRISQTLTADNKTKWFHKSQREQIACYERWQHDFSKIQCEEFCAAGFLSSHLFNLSPSFLSKAAPEQQANKARDLLATAACRRTNEAACFQPLSNCLRNGTDGKHSYDNVCIYVCWQMQSIFSLKEYRPVENILMWLISDYLAWGIIYQGRDCGCGFNIRLRQSDTDLLELSTDELWWQACIM